MNGRQENSTHVRGYVQIDRTFDRPSHITDTAICICIGPKHPHLEGKIWTLSMLSEQKDRSENNA